MIRTRCSPYVATADQCSSAIRPTTSHRGSPTVRAGTSTRCGSSHSPCACACTKPIPCLVVLAALFSGSNSSSKTSWYKNYATCVELPDATPALITDVSARLVSSRRTRWSPERDGRASLHPQSNQRYAFRALHPNRKAQLLLQQSRRALLGRGALSPRNERRGRSVLAWSMEER